MGEKSLELLNYVGGAWRRAETTEFLDVRDPATAEVVAKVPVSTGADVHGAAEAAALAFPQWRRTPPLERVQYLFQLRNLLQRHFNEISESITRECGKTLAEARGELQRGIENVEVATGIPSLMMGYNLEDVASGIDEVLIRQPIGVVAAITPFNFPIMIPLWYLPHAIACGNTFILKPSEKVPSPMKLVFELIQELGLPPGVVNLVHGAKTTVEALIDHPRVRAISLVGSTPVAKHVYTRATAHGKRAQCQGGAKNIVVIMPDAEEGATARVVTQSAFGCAGQRCLAGSVAVTVGGAGGRFRELLSDAALSLKVGCGLEPGVEMGPVITAESKQRIGRLVTHAAEEGARFVVDGRQTVIRGYEKGNFLGPIILEGSDLRSEIMSTEVFGPVLSLIHVNALEEAIEIANRSAYGNMACLFTSSGKAARKFRYEVQAGNIGINVGVAQPMAFFPLCGYKESFFGDLHGQGRDAIEFFTEKKVVVERWTDL
jgi:malonate-semialdehyde dehydrogenase (acetylating)/methylmalonate-semialdehyde dehydrogenase